MPDTPLQPLSQGYLQQATDVVRDMNQAMTPTPVTNGNREGLRSFAQAMKYPLRLSEDLITSVLGPNARSLPVNSTGLAEEQGKENMQQSLAGLQKLEGHYIVLPDSVNALMHIDHGTAHGDETGVTKAHRLARATGQTELAETIEAGTTSTHFQGRLTPQQICERGIIEEFGNPPLYQMRVIDKKTREEGIFNVDLRNFEDVGMVLENMDRLGTGQNIMSATEYAQLQAAEQQQAKPQQAPRVR